MFITHRNLKNTKHLRLSFGSGTKLFITFLTLRFFDMRRERHNFFLCWLFHLTPPRVAPAANYWSGLGDLRKSTCFVQAQISSNCFFFFKFQIPQLIASGHDVNPVPGPISYLGFLLWHLWLSHLPCTRVNTCTQCVHLTNQYTKPKGSQPD